MSKSTLVKLLIAIIVMFIVCIPELLKTPEVHLLDLSCTYITSNDNSYLPLFSNVSFMCSLEGKDHESNILESLMTHNHTISRISLKICPNSSHYHSELLMCYTEKTVHPIYHLLETQGEKVNGSLQIRRTNFFYSYEDFHFIFKDTEEDRQLSSTLTIDIYIRNNTDKGENATIDSRLFTSQASVMKISQDIVNISMEFDIYIPYYKDTLGILWIFLIVVICGAVIFAIIFKSIERKNSHLATFYRLPRLPIVREGVRSVQEPMDNQRLCPTYSLPTISEE